MDTNRLWLWAFITSLHISKNPTKHYEIIISCAMAMIIVFLLLFICNISELLACILLFIIGLASAYQIVFTAKVVSCVKTKQ